MFKILTLKPGIDADLQTIQDQWEIDAVENLGTDSTFNHYLLVQYNTKPAPPLSGSLAKPEAEAPKAEPPKPEAPKAEKKPAK